VAKTTGKKPPVKGKSSRGAAPAKGKSKPALKKPAKKSAKPSAVIIKKSAAKAIAAAPKKSTPKPVIAPKASSQTMQKAKAKAEPASGGKKTAPVLSRPAPRPVVAQKVAAAPAVVAPPANGKPGKNPAGFSNRELETLRESLLAKRRELIGDMSSMESEALRSNGGSNLSNLPIHMADMGTDNYEQEFTLGLVQKERDLLKEINSALNKIKNGTYGLCEGTGQPIIKERLEYQPWARYSVEYQRKMERHGR